MIFERQPATAIQLAHSIRKWWLDASHRTSGWGAEERNVFSDEPEFVTLAKSIVGDWDALSAARLSTWDASRDIAQELLQAIGGKRPSIALPPTIVAAKIVALDKDEQREIRKFLAELMACENEEAITKLAIKYALNYQWVKFR